MSRPTCELTSIIHEPENAFALIHTQIIMILDIIPALLTIIANAMLLVTLLKTRSLHTPSNVFVGGLCISDLLAGLVSQPLFLTMLFYTRAGLDLSSFTSIFWYSSEVFAGVSYTFILCITIDRYFAICHPFRYQRTASCGKHLCVAVALSLIIAPIPFISKDVFFWSSTVCIIGMVPVMLYCFGRIYYCIRKQCKGITKVGPSEEGKTSQEVQRRKQIKRGKEEKGKAYSLAIMFGCFVICYAPIMTVASIRDIFKLCQFPVSVFVLFIWSTMLLLVNSLTNPIIYCLRMRSIRNAARAIFLRRNNIDVTTAISRGVSTDHGTHA